MLLAASLERAVTHGAELLLAAGVVLALAWGLLQRRIGFLRWPLLVVAVATLVAGAAVGGWAWHEKRDRTVRGSPTTEFVPTEKPKKRPRKELSEEPWPLYGYNVERSRFAPFHLRPPFAGLWAFKANGPLEPPPVIAYGRVFISNGRGVLFAINARRGRIVWKRTFRNCIAGSPAVARGTLYVPLMHRRPCAKNDPRARGMMVALDAKTGRTKWRFRAGPIESAPLLVGHVLYFGSWDRKVYALNVRKRRNRMIWSHETDGKVVAAPAYANGTVYVGTFGGRVYAFNARTGRQRWRAESFSRFGRREYFYATPAVAYGRVYLGNTDGTVYAYGATTGHLLWARRAGTYVYSAPAVWRKMVYVGSWDGYFSALDARTGDFRWRFSAPGGIMGAPTVLDGLVYFSTFGRFSQRHLRRVKSGPRRTFALNARTGARIWRFHDGHYSPVVADSGRIYVAGKRKLYAFISEARQRKIRRWQALEKCARIRRAKKRARCQSRARRGTSSGRRGSGKAARTSIPKSRQPPTKGSRPASGSTAATS
ncbi:MAG: PQQ-binding-like beta-propeller repeat protein [Actinomycetota bacterium]